MSTYIPDKWVVVKIEGEDVPLTYKVFACWYGDFLKGDSWKMNSGIVKVTKEEDYYLFEGYSGSVYKCYEESYGIHLYGHGVLEEIIEKSKQVEVDVQILSKNTNWLELSF